jgi:crossover junction endodeoxyribonuclease RuvC
MAVVVGLDLSLTSTGYVALAECGGVISTQAIKTDGRIGLSRLDDLTVQILSEINSDNPSLIVIEGYAFGVGKGSSLADLAELGGIIKHDLYTTGYRMIVVPPARLKKFVTGKGNAKKDQMRLEVYKRWGFEHESNDVIDAYGLAQLGLAVLGHTENLTKEQLKVIQEIVVKI